MRRAGAARGGGRGDWATARNPTVEPFRDYHIALMLGAVLSLVGFRLGTR